MIHMSHEQCVDGRPNHFMYEKILKTKIKKCTIGDLIYLFIYVIIIIEHVYFFVGLVIFGTAFKQGHYNISYYNEQV
jgi:hypothetical protein